MDVPGQQVVVSGVWITAQTFVKAAEAGVQGESVWDREVFWLVVRGHGSSFRLAYDWSNRDGAESEEID